MSESFEDFMKDPFGGKGYLLSEYNGVRHWICQDEENPDKWHQCTVEYTEPLFEENQAIRNETDGQKFGDMRLVASIPAATYFNKILPAKLNGDQKWIKNFLNKSENQKYRTFGKKL